ncbi:hypothetical protein C8R43DRAFT_908771 [Mycena crocata]|nr:hypothetical protein C8R43DRAFT_908771 [Mycena crocata]
MSKFLGLPSATVLRESNPPKLLPSAGVVKPEEIAANIATFFNDSPSALAGHCLMADGLHLCQRPRWHQPTNQILGLCREHSAGLDLSMTSMDSVLNVVNAVHGESPTCHYGREATVFAVGAFRADNYHGLPILQTQSCQKEKGPKFAVLLQSILEQWKVHAEPKNGRLWVVGFDGASVFREGGFTVLMADELHDPSPLYKKLKGLRGLNLECSKDEVVVAPDPKHVVKSDNEGVVITTDRSNEGVVIAQTVLNRSIITQWLERLPDETKESVAVLVDPADHQNVPRAYKLIRACISLGSDKVEASTPGDMETKRAFALAGEMWRAFLDPWTKGDLSLSDALKDLSKFAHLAFVFYRMHGSSFLSNQLYADLQALVKAAFFCVAQQQNLDPEATFYLYQLGSDRLEAMFAEVRTESHDSNVDALQLSERLSSAADSVRIWNEHPEWHQGHVRRSWSGKEADHVNPTFYTADNVVGHLVLEDDWDWGCKEARDFLLMHGIEFDFHAELSVSGVDFLRPNGNNIYPGKSKEKDRSVVEDTVPAVETILTPNTHLNVPSNNESDDDDEPDLPEDDAPTVFLEDFLPEEDTDPQHIVTTDAPKNNGWLDYPLGDGSTKRVHKATILSTLFTSDYRRLATTRLLRVRCYTADGHKPTLNHVELSGEHSFNVGDLAVALIRSHNTVAAAVVRVTVLEKNKSRVGQVDVEDLGSKDSVVSVTAQPLILRDLFVVGGQGVESVRKWIWTGNYARFEPLNGTISAAESGTRKALTVKIPGALVHPLDAEVESIDVLGPEEREVLQTRGFSHTWGISNADFAGVATGMYEGLDVGTVLKLLPKHGKSDSFPYINSKAEAVFILKNATQTLAQKQHDDSQTISCFQCHAMIKPNDSRAHVGEHILKAMRCVPESNLYEQVQLPNPCGFCGRAGCTVEVAKAGQSFKTTSSCIRQHPFSYGHAKKFTPTTPSTNVPLPCILCDVVPPRKTPPAFWKYSILAHIQSEHPRYWDDLEGVPINLTDAKFVKAIAISREELKKLDIVLGLTSAPFAQTLYESTTRTRPKRTMGDITNGGPDVTNAAGPSKRPRS